MSTKMLGRLLLHITYNGRRMALRLPSARKEVLSPRMLQRMTANVNKTLSHPHKHKSIDSQSHFWKIWIAHAFLGLLTSSLFLWTWGYSHISRKIASSEKPFFFNIKIQLNVFLRKKKKEDLKNKKGTGEIIHSPEDYHLATTD